MPSEHNYVNKGVPCLGPVVQSIVSLITSLVVKMLTVLVSIMSNAQVFFAEKNVSSFCKCKSYSHFFSKNISIHVIFNDQSFNDTLNNDVLVLINWAQDVNLACLIRCTRWSESILGASLKLHIPIFVEIDHEIFSTVILSLLLIQEGQLSVSGERMCTILVNRLED